MSYWSGSARKARRVSKPNRGGVAPVPVYRKDLVTARDVLPPWTPLWGPARWSHKEESS